MRIRPRLGLAAGGRCILHPLPAARLTAQHSLGAGAQRPSAISAGLQPAHTGGPGFRFAPTLSHRCGCTWVSYATALDASDASWCQQDGIPGWDPRQSTRRERTGQQEHPDRAHQQASHRRDGYALLLTPAPALEGWPAPIQSPATIPMTPSSSIHPGLHAPVATRREAARPGDQPAPTGYFSYQEIVASGPVLIVSDWMSLARRCDARAAGRCRPGTPGQLREPDLRCRVRWLEFGRYRSTAAMSGQRYDCPASRSG